MTNNTILVLGARSDIGKAVAHKFAALGYSVQLAARNALTLEMDQADLELRYGVSVSLHEFDVLAIDSHQAFVNGLPQQPQVAVCTIGLMGQQADDERDIKALIEVIRSNYEGPASILSVLANMFESRGSGTIVGIGSVAGDRGRANNYIYGSAKAGLKAYLSGLRNRLAHTDVNVVTVLPGYVETQMTRHMNLPPILTAQAEDVAHVILKSVHSKKDVIYVKKIWALIMLIIRNIPEQVFKKMKI